MKPSVKCYLQVALAENDGHLPARTDFKQWLQAAWLRPKQQAEVTLRLVDLAEGQSLNRDYRGKDYATNVLTFGYDDADLPVQIPLQGDLVFCHAVVVREALEQNKTVRDHYAHLTVHGMLHLQGYDHEQEAEAEAMEQLERQILARLGLADPYAEPPCAAP